MFVWDSAIKTGREEGRMKKTWSVVLVACVCLVFINVSVFCHQVEAVCDGSGDGHCGTWMNPFTSCCMNAGGLQGYNMDLEGYGTPWLEEIPNQQCAELFDWYLTFPCSDHQGPCGGSMGAPC